MQVDSNQLILYKGITSNIFVGVFEKTALPLKNVTDDFVRACADKDITLITSDNKVFKLKVEEIKNV